MEPAAASLVLPPDDTDADTDPQPPQPSQPRPPSPHALNHAGLLALVASGEFSHQTTLRALRIHPEWLCTLPPEATETPLHAVVRTGNLRLLEMLLAEHPKALDLDARDGQGRTVWEVAMAGESQHPRMGARVEGLRAFEAGAYALCVAGELSDTARQDALVAALTRRLDWVSSRHHKAWSVLHHLVHHGDVPLLERVVGIPGSFAAIKLRARTRDCRRTVVDLARGSPVRVCECLCVVWCGVVWVGWGGGCLNMNVLLLLRALITLSHPFPTPPNNTRKHTGNGALPQGGAGAHVRPAHAEPG